MKQSTKEDNFISRYDFLVQRYRHNIYFFATFDAKFCPRSIWILSNFI